jgi:Tol biopolymer transport system component
MGERLLALRNRGPHWVGAQAPGIRTEPLLKIIFAAWFLLGISGCGGDFSSGPFPPVFPVLMDPIPYDDLAPGILVFQRVGPVGNSYIGMYAMDTRQKRSLGYSSVKIGEPAISPDGLNIAFTTYTTVPDAEDVYVMDIEGSMRHWITEIHGREESPSWTFDAAKIMFLSVPDSTRSDSVLLYRQSPVPKAGDRELLFDSRKKIPGVRVKGPVSMSPGGTLLVGGGGVWTISSDGSDWHLLIAEPGGGVTLYSPAWSPDGRNIAALAVTRNGDAITSVAVVLYAANGTGADTLVSLPASGRRELPGGNNYSLCWSPDGSQIAFTRPDGQEIGAHIYVINRDRSHLVQVTTTAGVTDRSLSWGREIPVQGG